MTISLFGTATGASGTGSSIDVPYVASVTSGMKLLMPVMGKRSNRTIDAVSGWTALFTAFASGAGSDGGNDEGKVIFTVFEKTATGSESGNQTVTMSGGTADVMAGRMIAYQSTVGFGPTAVITKALDAGGTTALSWAFASDLSIAVGDLIVAVGALNTDNYTLSGHALTGAGITASAYTSRFNTAVALGTAIRYLLGDFTLSAGPSSGNQTFAATASGSATNAPAGPYALIRLRESAGGGSVVSPHIFRPMFSGGLY